MNYMTFEIRVMELAIEFSNQYRYRYVIFHLGTKTIKFFKGQPFFMVNNQAD